MLRDLVRVCYVFSLLLLTAGPGLAQAQSASADLTGSVADPSKAVVSGATVTAVNLETGLIRVATSDLTGVYRVSLLPPGCYELKVRAEGFNVQVKRNIMLTVGQTALINFDLALGVKTETEVIETSTPVIEMERTHQSSTITQRPIDNLPLNGRNFLDFARLTPGVVEESPAVAKVLVPQLPTSGLSFAGQNGRSNSIQIDGVDNNDITSNGVRPTISQEAVREFQINRHGYNAEFGRASGGVINIVSKSGSNELHGNLYDYFRNERLDARNVFASAYRQDPPFKRNQPGFTLGGPLQRDRTFFFASYEGLIRRESTISTILADPWILNPTTGQQSLIAPLLGSTNPDDVLLGQQLQALLTTTANSAPQSIGPALQQNRATYHYLAASTGIFPVNETSNTGSLRIDHAFSEQDYLFSRYNLTNDSQRNIGIGGLFAPSAGFDLAIIDHTYVLGETHLFRGGSTNELRLQLVRNAFNANTVDPFGPHYQIAGIGTFGRDFTAPSNRTQWRGQVLDNYSVKWGRHNFKLGGDFNRYAFEVYNPVFGGGNIDFTQLPIPLGAVLNGKTQAQLNAALSRLGRPELGSVLLQPLTTVQQINFGLPSAINQGYGNPNTNLNGSILGLYLQDGLQIKPDLYLSFGLRYDYELQPDGTPRDGNNLGPRFGFTYTPFKGGKTLIRGGGGLYYQSLYTATAFISTILGRGQISNVLVSADPLLTPIAANSPCGQALASGLQPSFCFYQQLVAGGRLSFSPTSTIPESAYSDLLGLTRQTSANRVILRLDNNAVNPYSVQGSLGIDHQFGRDLSLSVNYLINRGTKLIRTRQVNALPNTVMTDAFGRPALTNRVDPTRLADYVYETAGSSIYHGLAVSLNKRLSRHYQLIGAYTFGKAIDDVTDLNFEQGPQDPTRIGADRSLSSFNVSHRLSLTSLFDSPFRGGAGRPLYDRILADFYLSPILTLRSGFPFNIRTGIDVNMDNNNNDRPFAVGRNTGLGPGFFTTDLRIGRRFRLSPDSPRTIEAIFDTFNLFNRVNYKEVNGNTGGVLYLEQLGITDFRVTGCADRAASSFCGFTSAYEPRVIQLAVKLNF
ncbi:MAG TPA: carboxypeptidase regulatory-like domain-containing protein [Blastocatellia bacterium]|nr:carboxypeptidase regulatory-like domain-containing protein [Blastocatellia bacterium]